MKTDTVLLSGGSGFIGSHIAEILSSNHYKVLILIRNQTDLWRLNEIRNKNHILVNLDVPGFKNEIQKHSPTCFIHSAWQGVKATERENWTIQAQNIMFTLEMLSLSNLLGINKIIALGSQAEYGKVEGRISEDTNCNPTTAYGAAKVATQLLLKSFCETHNINWFWLRTFSLYGERENESWLIPSLIKNILSAKPMDLTACEQRYDYMYAGDFSKAIIKTIETKSSSGIFNLSSNSSIVLKDIISQIQNYIRFDSILNFGALPYRTNQVMHIEGNSTKFIERFDVELNANIENMLSKVVNYYKLKFNS